MGSEEDSIEEAVASRRERLLALRAAQQLSNAPQSHQDSDNNNNNNVDQHQTPAAEDEQPQQQEEQQYLSISLFLGLVILLCLVLSIRDFGFIIALYRI